MAQTAKFIDVTRTFIPIDPNSFPESLHTGGGAESPEQRVPVSAYKGYNFLPTSYGYKSYFGNAQKLGIDPLTTRTDHIFIFQTLLYENILIALTETGIWTKKGEAAGAWTAQVPMALPTDTLVHYEWTYCMIGESLYAYRQGQPSYQKLTSSVSSGVDIVSITPNFLNMDAQIGIFRAEGRLAFWDSADSIGWSNMDDFADFTPSLETLAGNVKFIQLNGRIVTIKSHGPGFIIYCTKSIIYVQRSQDVLYQWQPKIVLSNAGISYPRQVTIASPDTTHFVITGEGMKKIENAQSEVIVPEVTDFFSQYDKPIFLKVLQNRYLFLEILDDGFLTGNIQFLEQTIPPIVYTFEGAFGGGSNSGGSNQFYGGTPGTELPPVDVPPTYTPPVLPILPPDNPTKFCNINQTTGNGFSSAPGDLPTTPGKDPKNPLMQPVYSCWIAQSGVANAETITWVATPCFTPDPNGGDLNMCPAFNNLDGFNQDKAGKTLVTEGTDPFNKWTMARFVALQMAIWAKEEAELQAVIQKIVARAGSASKTTRVASCVPVTPALPDKCTIGRFVSKYSSPLFGWSRCSFWLTRYAIAAVDIKRVMLQTTSCSALQPPIFSPWKWATTWCGESGFTYASEGAALAAALTIESHAPNPSSCDPGVGSYGVPLYFSAPYNAYVASYTLYDSRGNYAGGLSRQMLADGGYDKTDKVTAHNEAEEVADFGMGYHPESGFCELTGWRYVNTAGALVVVPANTCTAPATFPTQPLGKIMAGGMTPPISTDGTLCDRPPAPEFLGGAYTPGTYTGGTYTNGVWTGGVYTPGYFTGGQQISWPAQSITLPGSSFLLQIGSISPSYATMAGALVYDLHLKKWGKMRLSYSELLDYSPLNSTASGTIPYNTFGILSGILQTDGKISLFDQYPTDSYISYGKVGYYRLGMTSPQEVHVTFRTLATGYMKVETSLGGNNLGAGLAKTVEYTSVNKADLYGAFPGKWCNIEIGGIFDINYLEYRGFISGRR